MIIGSNVPNRLKQISVALVELVNNMHQALTLATVKKQRLTTHNYYTNIGTSYVLLLLFLASTQPGHDKMLQLEL